MRVLSCILLVFAGCARPPSEEVPMRAAVPTAAPSTRPALDLAAPARVETATFALG